MLATLPAQQVFPTLQTEPINDAADVRPIAPIRRVGDKLAPPPTHEVHPYFVSRYFAKHGCLPPWGTEFGKRM